MNNNIAIKVENVSKKYCKTLKRSMIYGINDIGKNMIGELLELPKRRNQ